MTSERRTTSPSLRCFGHIWWKHTGQPYTSLCVSSKMAVNVAHMEIGNTDANWIEYTINLSPTRHWCSAMLRIRIKCSMRDSYCANTLPPSCAVLSISCDLWSKWKERPLNYPRKKSHFHKSLQFFFSNQNIIQVPNAEVIEWVRLALVISLSACALCTRVVNIGANPSVSATLYRCTG